MGRGRWLMMAKTTEAVLPMVKCSRVKITKEFCGDSRNPIDPPENDSHIRPVQRDPCVQYGLDRGLAALLDNSELTQGIGISIRDGRWDDSALQNEEVRSYPRPP